MTKSYVIGKTYKFTNGAGPNDPSVDLNNPDGTFICHDVTDDADDDVFCWSMECTCGGQSMNDGQGWYVADRQQLISGDVVEV